MRVQMRFIHLLAVVAALSVAIAGCTTGTTPTWTYPPSGG